MLPRPLLLLVAIALAVAPSLAVPAVDPVLWPEAQRAFLQDGPGFLLPEAALERLLGATEAERTAIIDGFLADPVPETEENELELGIRRRQRLAVSRQLISPNDIRARVLFLHGPPDRVEPIECGSTFNPIEIWRYGSTDLVLYKPSPSQPFRLWLPLDTKRVLYTREMEYWLEQYYELRKYISGKRFDLQACPLTELVDEATGIPGLFDHKQKDDERAKAGPSSGALRAFVGPPADLRAWALAAAATPLPPELEAPLTLDSVQLQFPESRGQRIVARLTLLLASSSELEAFVDEGEEPELRLAVDGVLEQGRQTFEEFRLRFELPAGDEDVPVALVLEQAVRPERPFVVYVRIVDEGSGRQVVAARGFMVPQVPIPVEEPAVPEEAILALGKTLEEERVVGADSLILVPPASDVVLGVWKAEALVTGASIQKVLFLVDGKPQLSRTRPPFSADVKLAQFPVEQVVRAEGYDASGELVAADEVILNQPRGTFRVRILDPPRGAPLQGRVAASAEVVVPEGQYVETVEFLVDNEVVATLRRPPWQTTFEVPGGGGSLSYLTVVATLDDGSRSEDVRFLDAPEYLEEIEVQLVELYTTVNDRSGKLIRDLAAEDFQVFEDGRRQKLSKFELVEDLPLTLGITIDTSGSMVAALPVARQAALEFLRSIITPRDQVFAVSFSDRPILLIPPTSDIAAVESSLTNLQSVGWTSLHDAVVTSLYYFRAIRGRRALVLLSDGDDTASGIPYRDALEYARRSGVVVYPVGLNVSRIAVPVRNKLNELAEETGGRSFYISEVEELRSVYKEIEAELRSQYLLAYASDRPAHDGSFRTVEVKVERGKARTISGYYW